MNPPPGFPSSMIKLSANEARRLVFATVQDFSGIPFTERQSLCLTLSDAISFKTCKEIKGPYCDHLQTQFGKPVILSGPEFPEPPRSALEDKWELLLGFELTGLTFFAALKPPIGCDTIESALPEGLKEKVKGRGFALGGVVQQQLILNHPSVGCFVTHCGSSSLSEALMTECQLVLLPTVGDQIINARLMGGN
ncbi:hypothetical protein Dsin_032819 [Dipteronia sinensis]|uniref:Uncharacterized protein n=1 Tax=Dipteronia sinensis TaxID=43782 RepID=A0AAD9Z996_9ROSI|nr:hypothetical protein Dsin_032819 [Dipteronia sinensis]